VLEDEETAAEEVEDKLARVSIKSLEFEHGGIVCVVVEKIGREGAQEDVGEEFLGN
jgi:hypothetical protein